MPNSITHLRDLIAATGRHITNEFGALDAAGATHHPAPGEWCAKEVVGHLIEAERRGFGGRVRQMIAGEMISSWDQVGVAAARNDCQRTSADVLAEFTTERAASLELIDGLSESDLDASAQHPDVGLLTVRDILHEWPFHDRDHFKQILENTRSLLWSGMGAAQRFSEID